MGRKNGTGGHRRGRVKTYAVSISLLYSPIRQDRKSRVHLARMIGPGSGEK